MRENGFQDRTKVLLGTVDDVPAVPPLDAATLFGVLHHVPGDEAKRTILCALAVCLKPGAPLILALRRDRVSVAQPSRLLS
ncbi:hypothetical protein [Skermanella aerolata]|uniref:hypothetical protein n=1 Tax=Skermanella aerolata TaxID=393310 RepID=UPI0011BFB693|nr:hypothetical protein [Skermanella aerolata]